MIGIMVVRNVLKRMDDRTDKWAVHHTNNKRCASSRNFGTVRSLSLSLVFYARFQLFGLFGSRVCPYLFLRVGAFHSSLHYILIYGFWLFCATPTSSHHILRPSFPRTFAHGGEGVCFAVLRLSRVGGV